MNEDNLSDSREVLLSSSNKTIAKPINKLHIHFLQFCRFGIVGVTAAIVHYSCVIFLVQTLAIDPLVANIFAFIVAFQISYSGHRFWTFSDTVSIHRKTLPRLFLLQCLVFAMNETLYAFFLAKGLPYTLALIIVLMILPIFTFIISKFYIF